MPQKKHTPSKKRPAKRSTRSRSQLQPKEYESDSTYLLKLVLFVICGTLWLKFATPITWLGIPFSGVPIGLLIGLLLVHRFEKHQSDRKIWYACLLVVTIICYFVPAGILI